MFRIQEVVTEHQSTRIVSWSTLRNPLELARKGAIFLVISPKSELLYRQLKVLQQDLLEAVFMCGVRDVGCRFLSMVGEHCLLGYIWFLTQGIHGKWLNSTLHLELLVL